MKNSFALYLLLLFPSFVFSQQQAKQYWLSPTEKSDFHQTPRYDETMEYLRKLGKGSPWIYVTTFGKTAEGRSIPLVIVSKNNSEFNAKKAQASGKAVVLIQNAIHAGEMDGKDACMMLLRDMCLFKENENILDKLVLLILPIYNLDGHERFGMYNRINQNGPDSMGWRTTSQNLNLNRDYMKADAPETQAWLKLFNEWLPDFFIDCHVTDGADFQYPITYSLNDQENVAPTVRDWIKEKFFPSVFSSMEEKKILIAPYIFLKDNNDITKGIVNPIGQPRFSTEYCVLQNRPGFLIETHMLKDYKTRVQATYELLLSMLKEISNDAGSLRLAVRTSDEEVIGEGEKADGNFHIPLQFTLTEKADSFLFHGFQFTKEKSEISGTDWVKYSNEKNDVTIPIYKTSKIVSEVTLPFAYIIPQQWKKTIDVVKDHGIELKRLTKPTEIEIESYKFTNVKWSEQPFEGRHNVSFETQPIKEKRLYPTGTLIAYTSQRNAKVLVHLLEPNAPDALVSWGFFDAIFEQKEYGEDYVLEKLARDMLDNDSNLKKEFEQKLSTDSTFAKNSYERLNFFYRRSPYWDSKKDIYPIARVNKRLTLPTEVIRK